MYKTKITEDNMSAKGLQTIAFLALAFLVFMASIGALDGRF